MRTFSVIFGASLFALLFAADSNAKVPTPKVKPETVKMASYTKPTLRESVKKMGSAYLSESDFKHFKKGLRAARNRHWSTVTRERNRITDPIAQDVLRWAWASRDRNIPFDDLTYVVQQLPDWPRMVSMKAKAENKLFDNPLTPQQTLNWFSGQEPVSGEGRAVLATAHYGVGNKTSGDMWLKLAWRESKLTRAHQQHIFGKYKDRLTPADHAARADHLIWHGSSYYDSAQALLPYMSADQRALINARLKIARNGNGMDAAIKAVPENLQTDAGLLYERARWRRRKQSKKYALPTYLSIKTAPQSDKGKSEIWDEKRLMIYWTLQEKKYQDAYNLTLHHGMERGSDFAEAEFLAGWLAMQKLGRPDLAAKHFESLHGGVTYSVSLARARYWQGRAAEFNNDPNAQAYYSDASRYPNTYYGQLANEKLKSKFTRVILPPEADAEPLKPIFEASSVIRALHLIGEARDEGFFNQFVFHLDDEVEDIKELTLLSQISHQYGYMKPAIRSAKQAARFQSMLTESGYPMIDAINTLPDKFDKPFVFAIARQESEFNYQAVSHANAYGLMQMINGTASMTAKRHRIPYSKSRMTQDINYSANLGSLHLHDLLRDFDGSYIMAAAAYNAGSNRVKRWNRQFGDPRKGEIDPIDWVESIPFTETRNYVQRVMENVQVYRARMNNNQTESRIMRDLTVGAF